MMTGCSRLRAACKEAIALRKTPILLTLSLVLTALGAFADEGTMPEIFPYATHVENLENGLKVVLIPMESEGLVSYWTVVRTGARDEYEPGHTGFAHFFEHMMFRGTEKFPQDVYNGITTRIGADTNAFTSDDLTGYHLSITSEDLETVMEIEADRFMNLSYPVEAFKTEAGAVYGEYRKNKMNPFFALFEAVYKESFEAHTYGHLAMGYEEDIKRMPEMFDYSRSFFSRYYRPENCVLLIVGDIDAESTMTMVRKYYGAWEPGYVAPQIPAEPEQQGEKRIEVPYPGQSLPIIMIGYKAPAFDASDKGWVSTYLLGSLAFGETSDAHKKLVLDEQVAEFVGTYMPFNRDPGLFNVYSRVKEADKVDYVMEELDRVVARYRDNPPDPQRLADLKSRVKYDFLMSLDTPDHVASELSRIIAVTGGIQAVDTLYRTLDSIEPADIQAAAARYLVTDKRTVALLRGK
jgi:zinc protease